MILTVLLIFNCSALLAPAVNSVAIFRTEGISHYTNLIHAVGTVESNCDTLAYNPLEEATGYFQVRPIRLLDYNRRTGKHYKLSDMYDYDKAKKVFLYYASQFDYRDIKGICRSWNGKSKHNHYFEKVKRYLN